MSNEQNKKLLETITRLQMQLKLIRQETNDWFMHLTGVIGLLLLVIIAILIFKF